MWFASNWSVKVDETLGMMFIRRFAIFFFRIVANVLHKRARQFRRAFPHYLLLTIWLMWERLIECGKFVFLREDFTFEVRRFLFCARANFVRLGLVLFRACALVFSLKKKSSWWRQEAGASISYYKKRIKWLFYIYSCFTFWSMWRQKKKKQNRTHSIYV